MDAVGHDGTVDDGTVDDGTGDARAARSSARLLRLLGVYDADGGLVGELRYVVGHLLGTAECALCDITHSPLGRRRSWDRMVAGLAVPFDLRHRNELSDTELRAVIPMGLPVVIGELADGSLVELVDATSLATCAGDVDAFARLLTRAIADLS
jgi:hypothetical protein